MIGLRQNKVPYNIPMPNNMGVVRYLLALGVIVAHFNLLAGAEIPFLFSSYSAVGGFFALSGFLVYGSYLKHYNPGRYIRSRALRLLPAYCSAIMIFAIVLSGVSSLSVWDYFTSPQFWKYLLANLCFLNFLEPDLPGVFQNQDMSAVNVSLWTMKVEWMLYLTVPIVANFIKKTQWKPTYVFVAIYVLSICYRLVFLWLYEETGKEIYNILGRQFAGQLMYFYVGVMIYHYFDFFMQHKHVMLVVSVSLLASLPWLGNLNIIVHPLAFGSLVILVSMVGKWGSFEGKKDNVSYNMYLVHAPIVQLVAFYGLISILGVWLTFIISLVSIILLSVCMNIFIEKPIQNLTKSHFPKNQKLL